MVVITFYPLLYVMACFLCSYQVFLLLFFETTKTPYHIQDGVLLGSMFITTLVELFSPRIWFRSFICINMIGVTLVSCLLIESMIVPNPPRIYFVIPHYFYLNLLLFNTFCRGRYLTEKEIAILVLHRQKTEIEPDFECSICYLEGAFVRLPCNHKFHKRCIVLWMTRQVNCPMCRKPVTFVQNDVL